MGEMMRWDIINKLIEENDYKSYLEIGYYKGWSFDRVKCLSKMAVDPHPCKTSDMEGWISNPSVGYMYPEDNEDTYAIFRKRSTPSYCTIVKAASDDFFRELPEDTLFDIIFIDGLHEHTQVDRDIDNALQHLSEKGIIVLHDTNPPTYLHTTRGVDGCWTGDVYISAARRITSGTFAGYTVDTDWGVTILSRANETLSGSEPKRILETVLWEEFTDKRREYLNLISPQEFLNKFDNGQTDYNI